MKFVMIAELLLILFSNGIRFYAVKRYIDFFAAREKCLWKYNWILYTFACIGTYIVSIICKFCSNGTPILKLAVHPF